MNVGKICILFIRNKYIDIPRKINFLFAQFNSPVFMMQKSLLSFFKPLTEKSINQESRTKKNEEKEAKSLKSSPRNEKKELKSLESSSGKKEEPKSPKRTLKKKKEEPALSTYKNENIEQVKSSTSSPEHKRKRQTSPEQSLERTSPIIQKKRKRIVALESDSDEEVNQDSPSHKKKEEAVEKCESVKKEYKIFEQKKKTVKGEQQLCNADNREGTVLEDEAENSEKDDTFVKQEKSVESSECEDIGKDDAVEKEKEATLQKKVTTKKSSSDKRKTKKEVKTKPVAKKDDSNIVWKTGEKTPYLSLAKTLQKVEETSARLKIIDILAEYFRKVILTNKADLLPSLYLCSNTLGPAYEGKELGIADTYLMKAVAQCTGRSLAQIKADAAKIGDLGIVAEQSRSNQKLMFRPTALTVQGVFQQLSDIAKISGQNTVKRKIDKIQALFVSCQECEARFIIRSLAGKLRIGLAEQSILQALALACTTTPPNQSDPPAIEDASETISPAEFKKRVEEELLILKTTYCECPNYNLIVPALFEHGIRELPKYCKITPGIPVKPMLAHPTKGVHEVFQRFDNIKFTCEWKYDGERAQIHVLEDGSIKIYSRNQEDNTSKYPDIIEDIRQSFKSKVRSCIIDAESVAWDKEQKKIMPFQVLSTRKRKDADASEIKVRVCVFFFDLLYLNGESLTQKPLIERRNLLKEHFQEVEEKFSFVTSMDTNTMEEVQEFLDESVKGNCEGLMVKTLETEATYEIAKRSRNWLKLKKDYLEGCGDTLDLVVIGGYIGKGKRTGQYGGFLLASYNADNEEYQTICKIGTGFSEEALATHSEFLRKYVIEKPKPYYRYDEAHGPDQWFDAVQVWEIKCADLSLSPIYHSGIGLVDPDKGISLRFPRFLRIREDKSVEQATSSQQVADMYKNQDQIKNNASANESKFNEEDF